MDQGPSTNPARRRVLLPLFPNFEELELVAVVDILRRGGMEVLVAGLSPGREPVAGSHGIAVAPDVEWDRVDLGGVFALVLTGGPGTRAMGQDPRVLDAIRALAQTGRPVAAICAAPLVLARAGVLEGVRATSHPSARGELGGARVEPAARVVRDGSITTSQGAGTAVEFALALLAAWVSPAEADRVAEAIVHRSPGT